MPDAFSSSPSSPSPPGEDSLRRLHVAIEKNKKDDVTKALQMAGAAAAALCEATHNGVPALHRAAKNVVLLKLLLLVPGVNPDVQATGGAAEELPFTDGAKPLHVAAFYGNADSVKTLLEHQAQIESLDAAGRTPLHMAASQNQFKVAVQLLKAGANADAQSRVGRTPLHVCVSKSSQQTAAALLEHGAHIDVCDAQGCTALHLAAHTGHTALLETLLRSGADAAAVTEKGLTAAMLAAWHSHTKAIAILADKNMAATVGGRDHEGRTLLHVAARRSDGKTIELVIKCGGAAIVDTTDMFGRTCLHLAVYRTDCEAAIDLLIANGAELNSLDDRGRTALHLAAAGSNQTAVDCLIRHGANTDVIDLRGCMALDYAKGGQLRSALRAGSKNASSVAAKATADRQCRLALPSARAERQSLLSQPFDAHSARAADSDAMPGDDHVRLVQMQQDVEDILATGEAVLRQGVQHDLAHMKREVRTLYTDARRAAR